MSKKRKLLEIIQDIQELYPHLDRLLVDDVTHPEQIVITSEGHIEEVAREQGIDFDIDSVDTFFEEDIEDEEMLEDLFGFSVLDDDDDGGTLQ